MAPPVTDGDDGGEMDMDGGGKRHKSVLETYKKRSKKR